MIITGFDFHAGKEGTRNISLFLTDFEKNYGPVRVPWKDMWHSKDPIHNSHVPTVVEKLEQSGSEDIIVVPFGEDNSMIRARNNDKLAMRRVYGFKKMGDTDAARLLDLRFPDCELDTDDELKEAIRKQADVNGRFRTLHETYISKMLRQGLSDSRIETRLRNLFQGDLGKSPECPAEAIGIATEILYRKVGISNRLGQRGNAVLEPEKLRLVIDLPSIKVKDSGDLEQRLLKAFNEGKVTSSDIEVRGWKVDKHEVVLEAFKHMGNGERKTTFLTVIDAAEVLTEDVDFIRATDQHDLRMKSARQTSKYLIATNHNIGYDQEKKHNPKRDARQGRRIPGDGFYRPGVDNSQASPQKRRSGDGYSINGTILADTMIFIENYLMGLGKANLGAASAMFRRFSSKYNLDWGKMIKDANLIEINLDGAIQGKKEAIKTIMDYCGGDCDPPLVMTGQMIPIIYTIAKAVGADLQMAFTSSPNRLARLYWDRRAFNKISRQADADHKEDPYFIRSFIKSFISPSCLEDKLANTNIIEDFSVTEVKKALLGSKESAPSDVYKGLHVFYAPILAKAFWSQLSERDSLKDLMGKLEKSDDAIEQIAYFRLLEEITAAIAIDLKKVKQGTRPRNVFKRKFTKYPEELLAYANGYLSNLENAIEKAGLICSTGDLVFVKDKESLSGTGLVHLGECSMLKLANDSFIANFGGDYVLSRGISIPTPKHRFHTEPGESRKFLLETMIVYDFAHAALSDPEAALRSLKDTMAAVADGSYDWKLFLKKLDANRDPRDYSRQESRDVRLMKHFEMQKGDSTAYAAGSVNGSKNGFVQYGGIEGEFTPHIPYYLETISSNSVLNKIASKLWINGNKSKKEIFKRILVGEGSDEDVRYLLQPRAEKSRKPMQLALI